MSPSTANRAVVAGGEQGIAHVVGLQKGAITGNHVLTGGTALGATIHGSRVLATVDALSPVDFGAGPQPAGSRYLVEYDASGAYRAVGPVAQGVYYGLRATDAGAIVVAGMTAQAYGANLAPGASTKLPMFRAQVIPTGSGAGDIGVGQLFLAPGSDFDIEQVGGQQFVLVDIAPAP